MHTEPDMQQDGSRSRHKHRSGDRRSESQEAFDRAAFDDGSGGPPEIPAGLALSDVGGCPSARFAGGGVLASRWPGVSNEGLYGRVRGGRSQDDRCPTQRAFVREVVAARADGWGRMKFLVYWDRPEQADLLRLYLSVESDEVIVAEQPAEILQAVQPDAGFDAVLMAIDWPDHDQAFATFEQLRAQAPGVPVLGACPLHEVYRVARFLTAGMRSYLIRDAAGDYLFLVRSVIESVVQAVRAEREQAMAERLRGEIESVRRLQRSIIPERLRAPQGYHVVGRYEPSQVTVMGGQPVTMAGGDYYDALPLPDGRLAMLVADASGHGMKACLSIMSMHTLLRLLREGHHHNTAHFVAEVNRELCKQALIGDDGGFITLLYAVLDPTSHRVEWTTAGHPLPLLQRLSSGEVEDIAGLEVAGLPLGVMPEAEYESVTTPLPPGSRLLMTTDGLAEAFAADEPSGHHEFGREGLVQTLLDHRSDDLETVLGELFARSHRHAGSGGRHDDASVLLLERVGE